MSYLKLIAKTVSLVIIVTSFTACKEDGGFQASDFSIKENVDSTKNSSPEGVLSEEQIKALTESNEKRNKELAEEIALKNQVVSDMQLRMQTSEENIARALEEFEKVQLNSSVQDSEKAALAAEIEVLKEAREKDRLALEEALTSVAKNNEQIVQGLTEVINEINKIRKEKGTLPESLLKKEKEILAEIERRVQENNDKKAEMDADIQSIDAQLVQIDRELVGLVETLKRNPQDEAAVVAAINDLKAKKLELEQKKSSDLAQKDQADVETLALTCAIGSKDCESQKPVAKDRVQETIIMLESDISKLKEEKQNLEGMKATITDDISRIDSSILSAKANGQIPPMVVGLERQKTQQLNNLADVLEKIDASSERIASLEKNLAIMKNK